MPSRRIKSLLIQIKVGAGLLLALLLGFTNSSYTMDVTLGWDSDPCVASYRIYYKTGSSGGGVLVNYTSSIDVPVFSDENPDASVVEFTVANLSDSEMYCFVVTSHTGGVESKPSREVSVMGPDAIPSPYDADYNRGWAVTSGDLEGFKVFYHSSDGVTPTLGPSEDIRPIDLPGLVPVGVPLNLQTSGVAATFNIPVTVFIPCRLHVNVETLSVGLYEDGRGWILACDSDGNVQQAAAGWLVSEPEYHDVYSGHYPSIAIQLSHFSGAQAASSVPVGDGSAVAGSGGNGCFVSALTGDAKQ